MPKIRRRASDSNLSHIGSTRQTTQVTSLAGAGTMSAMQGQSGETRPEQNANNSVQKPPRLTNKGRRKVVWREQPQGNLPSPILSQKTGQGNRLVPTEPRPDANLSYTPSPQGHQERDIVPSIESDQPSQYGSSPQSIGHSVASQAHASNIMSGDRMLPTYNTFGLPEPYRPQGTKAGVAPSGVPGPGHLGRPAVAVERSAHSNPTGKNASSRNPANPGTSSTQQLSCKNKQNKPVSINWNVARPPCFLEGHTWIKIPHGKVTPGQWPCAGSCRRKHDRTKLWICGFKKCHVLICGPCKEVWERRRLKARELGLARGPAHAR